MINSINDDYYKLMSAEKRKNRIGKIEGKELGRPRISSGCNEHRKTIRNRDGIYCTFLGLDGLGVTCSL